MKKTAQGRGRGKGKAVQCLYCLPFLSSGYLHCFFHAEFDHMKIHLDTQWDCIACLFVDILNVQKLEEILLGLFSSYCCNVFKSKSPIASLSNFPKGSSKLKLFGIVKKLN